MATLYKRATPQQQQVLRIVEGAVKNALHAHPEGTRRPNFARSVAKRAVGTLSAQKWTGMLAANSLPSEKAVWDDLVNPGGQALPKLALAPSAMRPVQRPMRAGGGGRSPVKRSPLVRLWRNLASELWRLKTANPERAAAYVDVLKKIAALQKGA